MFSFRSRALAGTIKNVRMSSTVSQECPCPPHRSDASPRLLHDDEIRNTLSKLDAYKQRGNSIERLYTFKGFRGAIKFINSVADICISHNVSA